MDERVRSDVEMENKFYKRFQPGIMFSGNPFWKSLPGLRAPPAALRGSPPFFFNPFWYLPYLLMIVHLPIQAATTLKLNLMA